MPAQQALVSTSQSVLWKNADDLEKRGPNAVVQVFRREFFLPGLGQAQAHIGDEIGIGAGSKSLRQHAVLRNRLVAHTTKSRVNILVVGLEPVAKRAAQHARAGARGCTFHYVVLAVKEVRRVARIKRKRWKPGNGSNRLDVHSHPLPSKSATPKALSPSGNSPTEVGSQLWKSKLPRFELGASVPHGNGVSVSVSVP